MTLERFWIKAHFLPKRISAELNSTYDYMWNSSQSDKVKEFVEFLGNLCIEAKNSEPLHRYRDNEYFERNILFLLTLRREYEYVVGEAALKANDKEIDTENNSLKLFSLVSVCEKFLKVQQTSLNCNLPKASFHQYRALNPFCKAISTNNCFPWRQLPLSEMLCRRSTPM